MTSQIHRQMNARDWSRLVFLSLLWGGSFFFIAIAVKDVPPLTIVASRVVLAAAALWLVAAWQGLAMPRGRAVWSALLGMAVLNNVIPFTLFAWAQHHIPSGTASVLNATTPLWVTLAAHLLTSDEKITRPRAFGVLAGFVGVAVMLGASTMATSGVEVLAELACLGGALSYALSSIFGRRFAALGIPVLVTAAGQLTASSIILVPATALIEHPWTLAMPATDSILAVLGLAFASTALAYVTFFRILSSAGATNLMLVTFLIPVTANVLGVLVLGEHLAMRHLFGIVLIGIGLAAIDGRPWAALRSRLRRNYAAGA